MRRVSLQARRVSPALVVSVIALVAAVAGTAVAEQASISAKAVTKKKAKSIANKEIDKRLPLGTEDLADAAVTEGKLASDAVTSGKIAGSAVTTNKLANGASTAAKLAAGSVRAGKLGTIAVRTDSFTIPDNDGATVEAQCLSGERLIGGGVDGPLPDPGWDLVASNPVPSDATSNPTGWQGRAWNATGGNEGFSAYALCLQSG
jgi:hypothetical protein